MAMAARRGPGRSTGGVSGDGAGDGEGRRRWEEARARLIYGAAASYSTAGGGEILRRRCEGGNGGRGGISARCTSVRV
jgi:hypothetical protein